MIEFCDIKKSFSGREVLKGISFKVEEGQILFILGTSGTGKSVLLKNIVGLLTLDSGKIIIDGVEVQDFTENQFLEIRKSCGMVFQHPALFDSLNVFDNISYGLRKSSKLSKDEIKVRVDECMQLVNLKCDVNKKVTELSYGMQKRVSIARTLALKPSVLLFDEPTTGLDPVMTNVINELISNLSAKLNTTSIVVSHDMHCALDIADYIVVLDQGSVVDQGTPEQLKKSKQKLVIDFLKEVV